MVVTTRKGWRICVLAAASLLGCGDDDDGGGGGGGGDDGCSALCTESGYDGGDEMTFGEVVECVCSEGSGEIAQAACADYCSEFEVSAEHSYSVGDEHKCVCDGTQM